MKRYTASIYQNNSSTIRDNLYIAKNRQEKPRNTLSDHSTYRKIVSDNRFPFIATYENKISIFKSFTF